MSPSCPSILSLADLAAHAFSDSLQEFVETILNYYRGHPYSCTKLEFFEGNVSLEFKNNIYLPSSVAEKLIYTLSSRSYLTNLTLSLFNREKAQLRRLRIPNATYLNEFGFKILQQHNLKELDISNMQISLQKLLDLLNNWTIENMHSFRISNGVLWDSAWCIRMPTNLDNLKNIRELDVSHTEFNSHNLDLIVSSIFNLEALNISSTCVDSIFPLRNCLQLKSLLMADLHLSFKNKSDNDEILLNMKQLRHLDVSLGGSCKPLVRFMAPEEPRYIFEIMNWPHKLPNLISLDICGQDFVNEISLISFLEYHPDLEFLGLMSRVSESKIFSNPHDPNYRPNLKVTGYGSIEQIALAMRLYNKRSKYIQLCLSSLYAMSDEQLGPRPDIIELVTKRMLAFQDQLSVQVAGTACLYNLTKYCFADGSQPDSLPPWILSVAVERVLDAMEQYPSIHQVQKNALLFLCNDKILQEIKMNRFRCAKLVLNTLKRSDDQLIERLCVAISSVVAAKISSTETNEIGSSFEYMHKLLQIVIRKLDSLTIDSTLGFTLSALWNLTDESPSTCSEFLSQDGLAIFAKMLQTVRHSESVLTKILGLLNNIAEVAHLRHSLLQIDVISSVSALLKTDSIEISYFAAGILAHLLSDGPKGWTLPKLLRNLLLIELEATILAWKQADKEMVSYRSFRPFLPLLRCYQTYPAQLWALWATQHVLMAHAQKYYEMLEAENIFQTLEELSCHTETNELVRTRAVTILDQLSQFKQKKITSFSF